MKKMILTILFLSVSQVYANIVIENPTWEKLPFKAFMLENVNRNEAHKICYLVTGMKSSRAISFEVVKVKSKDLIKIFPRSKASWGATTYSDSKIALALMDKTMIDGGWLKAPKKPDVAIYDPIITVSTFKPNKKVKYFSSVTCE